MGAEVRLCRPFGACVILWGAFPVAYATGYTFTGPSGLLLVGLLALRAFVWGLAGGAGGCYNSVLMSRYRHNEMVRNKRSRKRSHHPESSRRRERGLRKRDLAIRALARGVIFLFGAAFALVGIMLFVRIQEAEHLWINIVAGAVMTAAGAFMMLWSLRAPWHRIARVGESI